MTKPTKEQIDEYIRNIAREEILKEKIKQAESQQVFDNFNKMQSEQNSIILGALNGWGIK